MLPVNSRKESVSSSHLIPTQWSLTPIAKNMNIGRTVMALLGASALIFLFLPGIRNVRFRNAVERKLKMIREALEEAEQSVIRSEERYDRILRQVCSYYMVNQDLQEALIGARDAMNEAAELAVALRKLRSEIVSSYSS